MAVPEPCSGFDGEQTDQAPLACKRAQNNLVKEDTLNHIGDPYGLQGICLI